MVSENEKSHFRVPNEFYLKNNDGGKSAFVMICGYWAAWVFLHLYKILHGRVSNDNRQPHCLNCLPHDLSRGFPVAQLKKCSRLAHRSVCL